jgi:hypothetical protein
MKASYSFRSWDVNGVPIAMFFATHFYFTLYFTLSNMTLHKVGRLPLLHAIALVYLEHIAKPFKFAQAHANSSKNQLSAKLFVLLQTEHPQ